MGKKALFVLFLLSSFSSLANTIMEKTSTFTHEEYVTMESLESDNTDMTIVRDRDEIIRDLINNMVRVEGGTFKMGATNGNFPFPHDSATPIHQVTLSSFSIAKYEVTQEEWETIMGMNPSKRNVGAKKPVDSVSWNDCQDFIRKLNNITGMNFRMLTESEWEFAARGGNKSKGYMYAGSDDVLEVAWLEINSNASTHDVGTKSPNELGLYDMSGNVSEWCQDWEDDYLPTASTNPKGPQFGTYKIHRGGYWGASFKFYCNVAFRFGAEPSRGRTTIGLRLAL